MHVPLWTEIRQLKKTKPNLLKDLKKCKDLPDLHNWAVEYNVELGRYSTLAFKDLCRIDPGLETLLVALRDDALNKTSNVKFLLHKLMEQSLNAEDAGILSQWLKATLSLGQQSLHRISLIMGLISSVSVISSDENIKHDLITSVLEGFEQSAVLSIKDLRVHHVATLLDAIIRCTYSQKSQDLGSRLIGALTPLQSSRLTHEISQFLQTAITTEVIAENKEKRIPSQMNAILKFFGMLRHLSTPTSSAILINISEMLIIQASLLPEPDFTTLQLLDQWWSSWITSPAVSEIMQEDAIKKQLERLLIGRSPAIVATYLKRLDNRAMADFILQRELLSDLDLRTRSHALNLFMHDREDADVLPFVSIMLAAHRTSDISEMKMKRALRLLQMLGESKSIEKIIVRLRNLNIRIPECVILDNIEAGLHDSEYRAERIFQVFGEIPLEQCPGLAERMIKNMRRHPFEALRLFQARQPGITVGCRPPIWTIQARAQLLERMATAYSTVDHIPSQMAFKYIYRCYLYHMREGLGHLDKGIVLALVRTGIVRPLEQGRWVSSMRLGWILHIIRKFEDPQAADQIDKVVYEWRGMIVNKIQMEQHFRKRNLQGMKEEPLSFHFRSRWHKRQAYLEKIMKPLIKPSPQVEDSAVPFTQSLFKKRPYT